MADEPHDPRLIQRILNREAMAARYLRGKSIFTRTMAKPQLAVANTVDGWHAMLDNDKFALVRGFVRGAMWGLVYGACAFVFAFLLLNTGPAAATFFGLGPGAIGGIVWAATAVSHSIKSYREALVMDHEKGARIADMIARRAGALPPPGVSLPLTPSHRAAQNPDIYQNADTSTRFRNRTQDAAPPPGRNV